MSNKKYGKHYLKQFKCESKDIIIFKIKELMYE